MKKQRDEKAKKCADDIEIVFSDDDASPAATGATEEEARKKLTKKLRKLCRKMSEEQGKECKGECGTEKRKGECRPRTRYTADDAISCFISAAHSAESCRSDRHRDASSQALSNETWRRWFGPPLSEVLN